MNSPFIRPFSPEALEKTKRITERMSYTSNDMYPYNNWINIGKKDEDKSIYRVVDSSRLIEMFSEKRNMFVHISKWKDRFEGLAFKNDMTYEEKIVKTPYYDELYGQSWCLNDVPENYIWSFYKRTDDNIFPVRIKSTIKKVWNSFTSSFDKEVAEISCFCGKVSYKSVGKIRTEYSKTSFHRDVLMSDDGRREKAIALFLLEKFEYFRFEQEFRFLFVDWNKKYSNNKLLPIKIDPFSFIESIEISPYATSRQVTNFSDMLASLFCKTLPNFIFQRDDSIPSLKFINHSSKE